MEAIIAPFRQSRAGVRGRSFRCGTI